MKPFLIIVALLYIPAFCFGYAATEAERVRAQAESYRLAAERSNANDARHVLNLIDRGLVTLDGPASKQVRMRLEGIVKR